MVATAIVECMLGVMLVSALFLRVGLVLLAGCVLGLMSPLVLFPADLFADGRPTLAAQYGARRRVGRGRQGSRRPADPRRLTP
jgi:putative oxidoreductase